MAASSLKRVRSILIETRHQVPIVDDMVWAAPDTLGWAYQFFITGEERREMRESSAPRNSRELAVRNQFFTPSYVVEFLVHNGLGAHMTAMGWGSSSIRGLVRCTATEAASPAMGRS